MGITIEKRSNGHKHRDTVRKTWWELPDELKPYVFTILVLVGVLPGLAIYFGFINMMFFVPSSFFVIVLAGLWYGRKALPFALFLGLLYIAIIILVVGSITLNAFFSASILYMVAFLVSAIVEQNKLFRQENFLFLEKIKQFDDTKQAIQAELNVSQVARDTSGRKFRFLSGIMHNDIFNNLSALIGSIDLLKTKTTEPHLLVDIDRLENIAYSIKKQIEFARTYEIIGTSSPQWLKVDKQILALLSSVSVPQNDLTFSLSFEGLEIFVDPLFEKVFANLINNSLNHGMRVHHISVSYLPFSHDIAIVYEDDGCGIHTVDKSKIFEKGVGKNPGFGLFLSREILSVTGLSIKECGVYGAGARFEIFIPEGKFRFT